MVSIASLWIPILGSAVAVFILSSIVHMVLNYHRSDYDKLPDEDGVMDALRGFDLPPGDYMMPNCTEGNAMKNPEFMEKWNKGPVALMTVWEGGPPKMGAQLSQWFVFCVAVGGLTAYVASRTLAPGTEYLHVFQVAGTVAFAAYAFGAVPSAIWYKKKWSATWKHVFDGFLYGLVTGGFFGWLWPTGL